MQIATACEVARADDGATLRLLMRDELDDLRYLDGVHGEALGGEQPWLHRNDSRRNRR
ncbi:MAG: hypothetical protein KY463_00395 [Actinobacteria bacterium]|nr:hypothetical protein [Actinomycetota bacterium]